LNGAKKRKLRRIQEELAEARRSYSSSGWEDGPDLGDQEWLAHELSEAWQLVDAQRAKRPRAKISL
jgi:hypothetical protein